MARKAKYYIYRNLNRGQAFSIKYRGKVIYRTDSPIIAYGVEFKVSAKGKARAVREGKRNVHAYAAADSYKIIQHCRIGAKISYNPFKDDTFMMNDKPIHKADYVIFVDGRCFMGG